MQHGDVGTPNAHPILPGGLALTGAGGQPHRAQSSTYETLRRECAKCKGFMGGDPDSKLVSHGIHPECAAQDWPSPYGMKVARMTLEPEIQVDAGPVRSVCGWTGEILIWTPKPTSAFGMEQLAIAMADDEVKGVCDVFDWTIEIRGGYLLALTPRDWSDEVKYA